MVSLFLSKVNSLFSTRAGIFDFIVLCGLVIVSAFVLWIGSDCIRVTVRFFSFLVFRPLSTVVDGTIVKDYIVRVEQANSTSGYVPAYEVKYSIEDKIFFYTHALLAFSGMDTDNPEVLTKNFIRESKIRPPIFFIPNSIPKKARENATLGEVFGRLELDELKPLATDSHGEVPIKLRVFKWFPQWPILINANWADKILSAIIIGTGLFMSLFILGPWYLIFQMKMGGSDMATPFALVKFLIMILTFAIVLKWPMPLRKQWLDPTARPRIPIDSTFSENTRLWDR
jgi:hypothetical protein